MPSTIKVETGCQATEDELYLAENCYGYGNWKAIYWFIGIEERMAPSENGDRSRRAAAFRKLNRDGLCDLHDFHREIGENRWMSKRQFTWERLIWLLKHFLNDDDVSTSSLLHYQMSELGRSTGETCVAELSGLPADSSEAGKRLDRQRFKGCGTQLNEIRTKRIAELGLRIEKHRPKLVVFYGYGATQGEYWKGIAKARLTFDGILKTEMTTFAWSPHPNRHGRRTEEWEELGRKLKESNVTHP